MHLQTVRNTASAFIGAIATGLKLAFKKPYDNFIRDPRVPLYHTLTATLNAHSTNENQSDSD